MWTYLLILYWFDCFFFFSNVQETRYSNWIAAFCWWKIATHSVFLSRNDISIYLQHEWGSEILSFGMNVEACFNAKCGLIYSDWSPSYPGTSWRLIILLSTSKGLASLQEDYLPTLVQQPTLVPTLVQYWIIHLWEPDKICCPLTTVFVIFLSFQRTISQWSSKKLWWWKAASTATSWPTMAATSGQTEAGWTTLYFISGGAFRTTFF